MRTALLAILVTILLASPAAAETAFPEFEQQTKEAQASWGYKVTRTKGKNPSFSVTIPSEAAAKCSGARLYLRSRENRLLAQFDVSPIKQKDGSLEFTLALFEELDGNAELIVYTDHVQGAALTSNFGGFTFLVKVEKP
ncbi:MAG: hypothetical protein RIC55_25575 [Pirellulaceae bacterium]